MSVWTCESWRGAGVAVAVLAAGAGACDDAADVLGAGEAGNLSGTAGAPSGQGGVSGTPVVVIDRPTPDPATVATVALASGRGHSCAVVDRQVLCWGANTRGEVGEPRSDAVSRPRLVPDLPARMVAVASGEMVSCGLDDAGLVRCWGDNDRGTLGQGDFQDRMEATPVAFGRPLVGLSLRSHTACAIDVAGALWCWGENAEHQLGQGGTDETDQAVPTRVGTASDWFAIGAGEGHVCGLRRPGTLWCWGRNSNGETGVGFEPERVREPRQVGEAEDWRSVHTGSFSSCGIRQGGAVYCWGLNIHGQVGVPGATEYGIPTAVDLPGPAAQVATDTFHSCAVLTDGRLYCWGRGIEGQLGYGDTEARDVPTEALPPGPYARVETGRFFTCALTRSGDIRCTGANAAGTLGTGDVDRRDVFTAVDMPSIAPL